MKLDKSELTTILVALRDFQNHYRDRDAKAIRKDWPEHFTDSDGRRIKPLGTADIDTLCDRLNR